jgi:hypothetical protein
VPLSGELLEHACSILVIGWFLEDIVLAMNDGVGGENPG